MNDYDFDRIATALDNYCVTKKELEEYMKLEYAKYGEEIDTTELVEMHEELSSL